MPKTYIALARFTDEGLRNIKGTVDRAEAARQAAGKMGVTMKEIYWTQGQYDVVIICETENEAAINAYSLTIASQGNVRFETLQAMSGNEMREVLAKLP